MKECNTLEILGELSDELRTYYIPCKRKVYVDNLTYKKSITLFRQFLKQFHYKCMGIEKSIKGVKQMTYRVMPEDKEQVSPAATPREYVIDFSV